jgi:hypothetical protein
MVAEYVATKLAVRTNRAPKQRFDVLTWFFFLLMTCWYVDVQNPDGNTPSFTELEGYLVGRMIADTLFRMRSR